ncbi:high affinity methionine permease [Dichomitus squalens]|uniref:High affinity methionine permease n=1 Tax=Dichomitus squalens TaxID=114155 RepID=A0A4Q9MG06_9APHY|nr:high affinity methionine permease [Dichomitus squalens]
MPSLWKFPPTFKGRKSSENVEAAIFDEQVDVKVEKSASDCDVQELGADSVAEADTEVNPAGLSLEEDAAGGMGRHLGIFSCTLLIVGRIIGTAVFSTPSTILGSVGSVGASLMLWVLGFIMSFCGLFIWLEFGMMFPRSGGEKVYLEAVYKKPKYLATVLFAANAILLGFTASSCIVFAQNILEAAGRTADRWVTRGISIGVIVFVTVLQGLFPKLGLWVMNGVTVFKIVILLFIVVSGWAVLAGNTSVTDPHANFRNVFAGSSHSSNDYATAMFKVLNAYNGWSNVNYVLNNVKDPIRTLKIAGPLGLGISTILLLLANVAYFAAATKEEIINTGVTVASLFFHNVFGAEAQKALTVFVALRWCFGSFAAARINQELAKDGIPLPFGNKFWASNWPTGKSPLPGLLVHMIPSIIIILGPPPAVAYPFIIDVEGYPQQIINSAVVIGLFWLRYHKPDLPRPFKVWLPFAAFFLVASIFLIIAPFLRPTNGIGDTPPLPYYLYCLVGIGVLALGVLYWTAWRIVPGWLGYQLVPRKEKLSDGTVVAVFALKKEKAD